MPSLKAVTGGYFLVFAVSHMYSDIQIYSLYALFCAIPFSPSISAVEVASTKLAQTTDDTWKYDRSKSLKRQKSLQLKSASKMD